MKKSTGVSQPAAEVPATSVNVGSLGSIMVNSGLNISNSNKPVTVQTLPSSTSLSVLTTLLTNQLKKAGYSVASSSNQGSQGTSSVSSSASGFQGVAHSQSVTQILPNTPEPRTYDFKG